MRGRLLGAVLLALASVTVWAAAIPFEPAAPIVIAKNRPSADRTSEPTPGPTAAQSTTAVAAAGSRSDSTSSSRTEFRALIEPQATARPLEPTATPVPLDLSTTPSAGPRAKPHPTDQPVPVATVQPEPTARATETPQPTRRPTTEPTASTSSTPSPKPTAEPTPAPTPRPTNPPTPTPTPTPAPATFSGKSNFWYPSLGIDATWGWYGCDYGGDPVMPGGIWRWGCGPTSNIYLLSHASSTFKKLRTAYHAGTLQVGQNAWYSNAGGDVTRWKVQWIRRVTGEYLNATAGDWADEDSPTPVMTLQTCDGSESQLRIVVRLVPAD